MNGYVFKVLLFFDIFVCALIFRDPDVTISSETGLAMRKPNPPWWAKALSGLLNHIQTNHCELAIQGDIARAQTALVRLGSAP